MVMQESNPIGSGCRWRASQANKDQLESELSRFDHVHDGPAPRRTKSRQRAHPRLHQWAAGGMIRATLSARSCRYDRGMANATGLLQRITWCGCNKLGGVLLDISNGNGLDSLEKLSGRATRGWVLRFVSRTASS